MRLPFNLRSKITPSCATAIVVSLAPLLYFLPATTGKLIIAPDDGVIFNIPMRVVVANLIRDGYLPLWNPYMFSGMPLFGAAQAGVLFPLNWLYLIFSTPVATNVMMLSTYVLAAWGAYLFARRSGAGIGGAAVTSLVWQWSAFMVGKVGQTNVVQTAALLPWILWAVDGYGLDGKRKHGVLLVALVAVQFFAGHQQTFAYSLMLAAAYAVTMGWAATGRERRLYFSSLALLLAGVALAAVQLFPTIELLRQSLRATATYDFFSSFSMPPHFVLTFLAPFLMGGGDGHLFRAPYIGPAFAGEYIAYAGVVTIMLATVALLLRRDARTVFWAVVALVCLALALGRFLPLNVYKLVYYVPALNLFRVPARHLMEVEFALAVLAGRGLTAMTLAERRKNLPAAVIAAGPVFLLTCLAVRWRPAAFQLARSAPVSIMRAPELFVPILMAALGATALLIFARHHQRRTKRSTALLFAILILDLCLFGQFSGWRYSPTLAHPLWRQPASVQLLRNLREGHANEPYRILTEVQPFFVNTGRDEAEKYKLGEFMLSLQPDTYVMHGVENAAGYDGFGLARYSRLAGDMKLWGEVSDPERSIRGDGREFDILNVQYLLKQSPLGDARRRSAARAPLMAQPANGPPEFVRLGGITFAKQELGAAALENGERLAFTIPPTEVNAIALVTSLAWAADVKDGTVVAHIRLRSEDQKTFELQLRAGEHTAEWSHDRPDLQGQMRHRRAPVATSYTVTNAAGSFESHAYLARFALPQTVRIESGEIELAKIAEAPKLSLEIKRVSFLKNDAAEPLRGDWTEKLTARTANEKTNAAAALTNGRWRLASDNEYLRIYENTRALPRAWLTNAEITGTEQQQLEIIRSGKLPSGEPWDPRQTALLEAPSGIQFQAGPQSGTATVTKHQPNSITVQTESPAPAILVLSENHYPGWRAYVDGHSVDVMRVNYNLRGVAVPPGKHEVQIVYRPKSVLIGLLVSVFTLAGLWVWSRRQPKHA